MLFSELNKINLNVLLQDTDYESVPDLSACVVHNKKDWTLFVKKFYAEEDDETVVDLGTPVIVDGWETYELYSKDLEDSYLNHALTDISNSLVLSENEDSDIVKIYAGQFDVDGTLDYDSFIEGEELFSHRHPEPRQGYWPFWGSWWTFNNGAFQWIGGPKSIFECRYSYGPFNYPPPSHNFPRLPHVDPHHFDSNHKKLDEYVALSIIPNLIFIFDPMHVLKGIVSIPCANEELREMTKNYIENLLNYAHTNFSSLSFKNIDTILYEFSKEYAYIPLIRVAKKNKVHQEPSKPVEALIELEDNDETSGSYKYILPDNNKISTFLDGSIWKTYSVKEAFENVSSKKVFTLIGEHNVFKPLDGSKLTVLVTMSDIFKQSKIINKLLKDETDVHFIILPTDFCNKEFLKFISNVKYLE